MSLAAVNNLAIENLIQSSNVNESYTLKWIPYEEITDVESTQIDNVYYAIRKQSDDYDDDEITLVLLGNDEICTSTL